MEDCTTPGEQYSWTLPLCCNGDHITRGVSMIAFQPQKQNRKKEISNNEFSNDKLFSCAHDPLHGLMMLITNYYIGT